MPSEVNGSGIQHNTAYMPDDAGLLVSQRIHRHVPTLNLMLEKEPADIEYVEFDMYTDDDSVSIGDRSSTYR